MEKREREREKGDIIVLPPEIKALLWNLISIIYTFSNSYAVPWLLEWLGKEMAAKFSYYIISVSYCGTIAVTFISNNHLLGLLASRLEIK